MDHRNRFYISCALRFEIGGASLASQSRFDPNWAVAQDLELELKSKLEPKLKSL